MSEALEWFADLDWVAIGEIIVIDILLGGDNALLIALACRNLPEKQRRLGILWGSAGAIVLRVILITVAVALLDVPLLKLIGGLLLLWIGVKLVASPAESDGHGDIQASDKLWLAIKTIIVADFVMSLDNVIAIAGAAEQADPSQRTGLIIGDTLLEGRVPHAPQFLAALRAVEGSRSQSRAPGFRSIEEVSGAVRLDTAAAR